jgi:hypothetical protein
MAQKTIVALIDDLEGGDADETVHFGLDGATYEIDLAEKNAHTLRGALAPFVAAARRSGGRTTRRRSTASGTAQSRSRDDTAAIREWARTHGHTVSERGRIAATVIDAYNKAH